MYSVQVEKNLQIFIQIFYRIGIWQSDEESTFRKVVKKLFYTLFGAWLPIFFAVNSLLCNDRNESIFSIQATLLTAVIYLKLLYLLLKKKEILVFLNDQCVVHSIFENPEDYKHAERQIKKLMKFAKVFSSAIFVTSALLIVVQLPIFSTDKGLPMFISFLWNDSEIIYWLAYLFVSLSLFLYKVIILITVLIWYVMLNYSIEYQLLGNKLRNLGVKKKTVHNKKRAKSQNRVRLPPQRSAFVEDFIVWIKAHRNLTETIERFRSDFSPIFLVQITTSGIIICVAVFNLAFASHGNIIQTQYYIVILMYGTFDIFFVMYLGNEITDASDQLTYCLFKSDWVDQTESCKEYVLIMGEVLKQPLQLVILIYPLNLETFTAIVNGGYSMFNIMKSFQ